MKALKIILFAPDLTSLHERITQVISERFSTSALQNLNDPGMVYLAFQTKPPDIFIFQECLDKTQADSLIALQGEFPDTAFFMLTGSSCQQEEYDLLPDKYIPVNRIGHLALLIARAVSGRTLQTKGRKEQNTGRTEDLIAKMFYQHPYPKWIYDYNTLKFLNVNDAAIAHYGYSREEFLQMTIRDIRPPEDIDALASDLARIKTEPHIRKSRWRHVKKNNECITVDITAYFVDRPEIGARMVEIRDVTEAVRIEKEKEFAANNLAALINNTQDLIWSVDQHFRLITCNAAFAAFFENVNGYSPVNGSELLSLSPEEKVARWFIRNYERVLSGKRFAATLRFGRPQPAWIEVSFNPIFHNNSVVGIACFCQDISERKRNEMGLRKLEEKLNQQKVQAQKKVTLAILEGQEKERNHIGRELHDNINQILASAKLRLSAIANNDERLQNKLKSPLELIQSAIQEIRSLTSGYVAPLDHFSLREMIQYLLDTVHTTTKITAILDYNLESYTPVGDLKMNLYRIVQEQINNILKYAEARTITIAVRKYLHHIVLIIADDGKGFDPISKSGGIGLSNMTNRIKLFNGEISIESQPGFGCKVSLAIPVETGPSQSKMVADAGGTAA